MSENSGNVLEANNILSTEIYNAVKDNKTNNANTSNENRKSAPKNKRNKNDQNKVVTATVGDSMIEELGVIWQRGEGGCEAFQRIIDRGYKGLHSASLKRDPDQLIIHIGTNDLRSSQDPETIAKNIDFVKNSTTNENEILISSIDRRRDIWMVKVVR